MKIKVYTDGSCRGNPGPGGWGAVILYENKEIQLADQVKLTTNQQMELLAAAQALEYIEHNITNCKIFGPEIILYTDSAYLFNCWKDEWWKKWVWNGWLNTKKEPVANQMYWESLIPWFKNGNFSIVKVKGHAENKYNNIADLLATGAIAPTNS